ncbi:MAG: S41 family peptidase [Kofleriaceae bacterium]
MRGLILLVAACGSAAAPAPKKPGAYHDPDGARGQLPSVDTRKNELALVRHTLDTMYAHRLAKLARYHLDEDQIFAAAEKSIAAATSWYQYDAALYAVMAAFHDGHLSYHPPQTAAPKRGYYSVRLGLKTVIGGGALLVAAVDPGSEVAAAGVGPGDAVIAIDDKPIDRVFARETGTRGDARPESALVSFAKTWTSVLVTKGDKPRQRSIGVRKRSGGDVTVQITPKPPVSPKKDVVAIEKRGDVAIVTLKSLEGGKARQKAIDTVLADARSSKGIVIDLRGDRGGIDTVGHRVVAGLVPGKAAVATYRVLAAPETLARRPKWKDLVAEADGFSAVQTTTVDGLDQPYAGKVAVIVDAGCISTCEVVAAALRADIGAVLVGDITGGSSGAPVDVALPASKGSLAIPTWNLTTPDGKPIEDDGVAPDLVVGPTPDGLAAGHDEPLDAAIARVTP